MVIGSVPAAFLGAYLLHLLGNSNPLKHIIETALGVALLIGRRARWCCGSCSTAAAAKTARA